MPVSEITDPPWHLIVGGYSYLTTSLKSVELYNWKTGEQCELPDLPYEISYHTGVTFEGTPAFCGGGYSQTADERRCYKFEKSSLTWTQVINVDMKV